VLYKVRFYQQWSAWYRYNSRSRYFLKMLSDGDLHAHQQEDESLTSDGCRTKNHNSAPEQVIAPPLLDPEQLRFEFHKFKGDSLHFIEFVRYHRGAVNAIRQVLAVNRSAIFVCNTDCIMMRAFRFTSVVEVTYQAVDGTSHMVIKVKQEPDVHVSVADDPTNAVFSNFCCVVSMVATHASLKVTALPIGATPSVLSTVDHSRPKGYLTPHEIIKSNECRAHVEDIFRKVCPQRLSTVDALMDEYQGREDLLLEQLSRGFYEPIPPPPQRWVRYGFAAVCVATAVLLARRLWR
jgi:hypothetical protein